MAIYANRLSAQPIPANDSDIDAVLEKIGSVSDAVQHWSTVECAKMDCQAAQDFNYRVRNSMMYMRYTSYWLGRAVSSYKAHIAAVASEAPVANAARADLERAQQRQKKAEQAYLALRRLVIINNSTNEGALTRYLLQFSSACSLDLGYVSNINVPASVSVSDFNYVSEEDLVKSWGQALIYLNARLQQVAQWLGDIPATVSVKPSLKLEKSNFLPEENFTVNFTAPVCYPSDSWIGIVKSSVSRYNQELNAGQTIGGKSYLNRKEGGSAAFKAPTEPGTYEVRMFELGSGIMVAYARFTVERPAAANNTVTTFTNASWSRTAVDLSGRIGQRFTFYFAPGGKPSGTVWGTGIYTDDSPIAKAALHAGLISPENGGRVTIEIRAGQSAYRGSTNNGISTSNWGGWGGSYVFVR
jgi:hypothetical protein